MSAQSDSTATTIVAKSELRTDHAGYAIVVLFQCSVIFKVTNISRCSWLTSLSIEAVANSASARPDTAWTLRSHVVKNACNSFAATHFQIERQLSQLLLRLPLLFR